MSMADKDDILSLIALVIFADKHVHLAEIESFIAAARHPHLSKRFGNMNAIALRAWYDAHKISLLSHMRRDDFSHWFRGCLDRITDPVDRAAILSVMSEIALSDQEFHKMEQSLIHFTAYHWNMDLPL